MRNPLRRSALAGLLAILGTACGTTSFTVSRRAPAEIDIPVGTAIAVAAIDGEDGAALVGELTQALVETKRFQVLERQRLDAALKELELSANGHVSDDSAISFGQLTGAATLVVGEVVSADYREETSEMVQQCSTPEGLTECTKRTRTGVASLHVNLKVIETETGRVLAAKNLTSKQQKETEAVDAEPPALEAKGELLGRCRSQLVRQFIAVVAPHDRQVQVALRNDDDLPELETGNNYARIGNWESAVAQYRSALAKAESAPLPPAQIAKALYNLGIGLGYSGGFGEGIGHIERAYALDPDELYRQQLAAVRGFKDEAARLREQEPVPE